MCFLDCTMLSLCKEGVPFEINFAVGNTSLVLQEVGRLQQCKQAIVNPSEDCKWNLLSSCSNMGTHHCSAKKKDKRVT